MSIEFFDKVYGESTGYVDIVTWGASGEPDAERWLEWPAEREFLDRYVFTLRTNEDVYTTVNLFSEKERTKNDLAAISRAIGVDADTCNPSNFRLPPSAIVQTSEDRWHCWWFLDEEISAHEGSLTAQRIAKAHEDQGCDKPGTHAVSKILRVPGTANNKYGNTQTVTVQYTGEGPYTLDTINAVYADIALGSASARQEATTTADFDESMFSPEELDRLAEYAKVAWEQDEATLAAHMVDGEWHTTAYKVACNMFRNANVQWSDYTHEQAEAVITEYAKVDSPSSQYDLNRVFRDARAEVGSDSLAMPAWALDRLPDLPPELLPDAELPALEDIVKAANLVGLYTNALAENETSVHRTHALAKALFAQGLNARQVFTLACKATANLYRNKRSGKEIWADVQWALEAYENPETEGPLTAIEFLSEAERGYLKQHPCFVDQYVAWVSSHTDAAPVYSQSLAWMALSAAYASRAKTPWDWEMTPLNLWLLVLGDTTKTRKSTSKGFFIRLVRAFEAATGEMVDIGSDSTAEGLTKVLGPRDGATSMLHIDEVNGFFKTAFTKNYQAGVIEKYTELYDGNVPVSLRATEGSGNAQRATTQFMLLGVGIRKKTAEILTKSDFESGFLARMLWAVADPPAKSSGEPRFKVRKGNLVRDDEMYELVDALADRAATLDPTVPRFIAPDDDALDRLNAWADITDHMATKYGDGEVLVPSVARLQVSVAKAAALLALHEGFEEIQLRHVLFALRQAELWFRDMVRMASEVSASDWERRQDEVSDYIVSGTNSIRTDQAIRSKFSRFRPQEMDEVLTGLTKRGKIRKSPDNAKAWQALV